MKGLLLKSVYTVGHNKWNLLFILIVFGCLFIPQGEPSNFPAMMSVVYGMLIITSFSLDERAKWTAYALTMPVSRDTIVLSNFIALFTFSAVGASAAVILEITGGSLFGVFRWDLADHWISLFAGAGFGIVISCVLGSLAIPLLYRFGAEKARILAVLAFPAPVLLLFGIYKVLDSMGIHFSASTVSFLLYISPLIGLIWIYVMYLISCGIFRRMEY